MEIRPFDWHNKQPLAEHYVWDFSRVRHLYSYNPWNEADWKLRAQDLGKAGRLRADQAGLARVLREYNRRMGNTERTLASLDALEEGKALVVIGGQQAGLFTGPMLVIHKALSILKTAERASAMLGRPVLPVFWIAGEDHDWDEVNHYYMMSRDGEPQKIRLHVAAETGKTSVSHVRIRPEEWRDALRELGAALADTEYKPRILEQLSAIHEASGSLSEAFARIMTWLFGKHGLIVMDAADPALRALEGEMFLRLLDDNEALSGALMEAKAQVEGAGYRPQAEVSAESAQLFVLDEGQRRLLVRAGNGAYRDKRGMREYSAGLLRDWAQNYPERLSTGALARPIMQEYLFPVLATVLGPAEIAYWGLLRPAFELFGMNMPVIVPRTEFTLIEPGVRKTMDKFEFTFSDVVERFEEIRTAWLKRQDRLGLDERFARVKEEFQKLYEPVLSAVSSIHDGMARIGQTNLRKIMEQIDYLHARSVEAYQSRFDQGLRQLRKAEQSLLPLGKPQERVYNVLMYLNQFGCAWLDEWIRSVPAADGRHYLIYC